MLFQFAFQEMEAYIRGLIPNLAQLRDMPAAFVQMYCRIAAHKFFFFCDPNRRGLHGWYLLDASLGAVYGHIILYLDFFIIASVLFKIIKSKLECYWST